MKDLRCVLIQFRRESYKLRKECFMMTQSARDNTDIHHANVTFLRQAFIDRRSQVCCYTIQ